MRFYDGCPVSVWAIASSWASSRVSVCGELASDPVGVFANAFVRVFWRVLCVYDVGYAS